MNLTDLLKSIEVRYKCTVTDVRLADKQIVVQNAAGNSVFINCKYSIDDAAAFGYYIQSISATTARLHPNFPAAETL